MGEHRIVLVNADERHILEADLTTADEARLEAEHISADNPNYDVIVQCETDGRWEDALLIRDGGAEERSLQGDG